MDDTGGQFNDFYVRYLGAELLWFDAVERHGRGEWERLTLQCVERRRFWSYVPNLKILNFSPFYLL